MNLAKDWKFELFYSTGGHSGPYYGLDMALQRAKQLALGGRMDVEVRPYSMSGVGGYGDTVKRVWYHRTTGQVLEG